MDFPDFPDDSETIIQFHFEEVEFELPTNELLTNWIENTVKAEKRKLKILNFIFCNDHYLHEINVKFLDHDTLTDVITFPYTNHDQPIEGDIYISIDRIKENAQKFNSDFNQELKRVMIHGVLHLCGYGDKSKAEQKVMRAKENFYLGKITGLA